MPRANSSICTPARLSAVRWPAIAWSAALPWTCTPRTRSPFTPRKDFHFLFFFHFARDECPGNHRAKALHGKDAVNRQAEKRFSIARRNIGGEADDFAFQLIQSSAFERAYGDNRRAADIEKRSAHKIFNLHADDAERVFVNHVATW